jgi:hypothetical protein
MRKVILAFILLTSPLAFGQYINVLASSCIGDGSGALMASGTFTVQGTDDNGNTIPYRVGTNKQAITSPIVRTITTGTLAALQLGDPASTNPLNVKYQFTIQDNSTKRTTVYKNVSLVANSGANFDFCLMDTGVTLPALSAISSSYPRLVASVDLTVQSANISATTFYTVPAASGFYRISCYVDVTQVATTSATLPTCRVLFTDADSNTTTTGIIAPGSAFTTNTLGANNSNSNTFPQSSTYFRAKNGTAIQYQLLNYTSSGATPMQFSLHIKLEYMGN